MKEIYSSGLLTVTKSPVTNEYTFHGDRVPLLKTTPQGALELAEAIIKEEKKGKDR